MDRTSASAMLGIQGCRHHNDSQRESGEVFHINIGRLRVVKSHA